MGGGGGFYWKKYGAVGTCQVVSIGWQVHDGLDDPGVSDPVQVNVSRQHLRGQSFVLENLDD